VLDLIDYPSYFSLLEMPISNGHSAILNALQEENLIKPNKAGHWDITCLGAILFAKRLENFPTLKRKALRIIQYKGNNKVETLREYVINKGYAAGFEELVNQILTLVPANEYIEQPLRKVTPMYPELAIRELVANALIHQDFFITGTSPMIELFDARIEITNPGIPLVATDRFLDTPPKSRNETLASLMRRLRICEERGSGIDKVVFETELFQLPPPIFETTDDHTRTVLFAHKQLKEMDKAERIWACYLHACLRYVQRDLMTNTSLRQRFGIDPKNSSMVSRIIKETIAAARIYCYDDTVGNKAKKYCPSWAK
jgi:predicted HTH transcriptional regulator